VYAKQMVDRLTRRSEQLGQFPQSGRMVPEYASEEIREVIEGSYRLIYRLRSDRIDIIAVIHSATASVHCVANSMCLPIHCSEPLQVGAAEFRRYVLKEIL